jgi:hypothetical protein
METHAQTIRPIIAPNQTGGMTPMTEVSGPDVSPPAEFPQVRGHDFVWISFGRAHNHLNSVLREQLLARWPCRRR